MRTSIRCIKTLAVGLALMTSLPSHGATETLYTIGYSYDEMGRLIAEHGPHGQLVSFTYDASGNLSSITDGEERSTIYTYDALNRLSSASNQLNETSRFSYDSADRVIRVVDPKNNATTYTYDGFGQLWKLASPDTGVTQFTFDAAGRRTSMVRADGSVTTFDHDGLGRLTQASAGGLTQTLTYDECTNGKGRLCRVSDPSGHQSYAYTPEGWLASQQQKIGSSSIDFGISYDYDHLGRLIRIDYPNSVSAHYAYSNGQLTTVRATVAGATQNVATSIKHLPFGGVTEWNYGNGLKRGHSYVNGRLQGVSTFNSAVPLQSLTLGYNDADEITGITNAVSPALTQHFSYDHASRLKMVTATNAHQDFAYDANGNRISHTWGGQTDHYNVAPGSNKLQSVAGPRPRSFTLDPNGNVILSGGIAFEYDPFNRLTQARNNGVTTNYWVNALGQRVRKDQGSTATTVAYLYGASGMVEAEYGWGGPGWTNYLRLPNGEPVALVRGGQLYMIHTDQLGRPELVTNASKVSVWRASNYAFDRVVTLDTIGNLNLGLPGQYFDAETGLWQNYFRDYDSSLGRYIQPDPTGLGGGANTYSYVTGNPVSKVDPNGLWELDISYYKFFGGGLNIRYSEGRIEATGRFGLGLGIGISIDPIAKVSAHATENCDAFGLIGRTVTGGQAGLGIGPLNRGFGGRIMSGNAFGESINSNKPFIEFSPWNAGADAREAKLKVGFSGSFYIFNPELGFYRDLGL